MSDLHGCLEEFDAMLETIEFSKEDELYIIGDVIDRGPQSIALLKKIMGMKNVTMLLGNHEDMMLKALDSGDFFHWNANRGMVTYAQYLELPISEQKGIVKFLEKAPLCLDLEVGGRKFHLVHACPSIDDENDSHTMLWSRPERDRVFFEDKIVIIGHTPTCYVSDDRCLMIYRGENLIYIDCGCFFSGVLGCIRLDDLNEFYVIPKDCEVIECDEKQETEQDNENE